MRAKILCPFPPIDLFLSWPPSCHLVAHPVGFRDDWGEETKADAAQLFDEILAEEGGTIDAAYAAAAHLPSDLTFHNRQMTP